ncbi:uncharacterized protein BP5553_01507 [Venustampulla echinocandica]|uniref:DUF7730 domain-containing protein n=1 Tax=Venustampulla echinocandica TaxID=2656787 RepID=A0A370U177_9HELO|nr:uncharacterized protein BP5553_01507 [Venustampulla echinocandica]RDL41528.1 hypothetical protein BP5553_01507 [Venustampulla echinocandica]
MGQDPTAGGHEGWLERPEVKSSTKAARVSGSRSTTTSSQNSRASFDFARTGPTDLEPLAKSAAGDHGSTARARGMSVESGDGGIVFVPGTKSRKIVTEIFGGINVEREGYSEAIDILYSTTTFNFASRHLLYSFPSLVLPQRFALISSIEMTWEFVNLGAEVILDAHKQLYNDMWAMLAGMPNLRRIKVAVGAHECPDQVPADLQEVWLGPLKQVGRKDIFELLVPVSYGKHFRVDDGSNFTLLTVPDIITAVSCFGSASIT